MLSTSQWCLAQLLTERSSKCMVEGTKAGGRQSVPEQNHRREMFPNPVARSIAARTLLEELLKRMEASVASGGMVGSAFSW